MPSSRKLFGAVLLACVGVAVAAPLMLRGALAAHELRAAFFVGPRLLDVQAPEPGGWRQVGGVRVLVRFPSEERVAPETFRCLLNGRDVTEQLTVGVNGVAGTVAPLLEGENTLELEIFGRGWWSGRYYQDGAAIRLDARSPIGLDRG